MSDFDILAVMDDAARELDAVESGDVFPNGSDLRKARLVVAELIVAGIELAGATVASSPKVKQQALTRMFEALRKAKLGHD